MRMATLRNLKVKTSTCMRIEEEEKGADPYGLNSNSRSQNET